MFCTKCGKELYDGDKFCAHCGAPVREPKRARYDDVVFNPPFKIEAERRTEEILKTTETPQAAANGRETVSFDWNLEGFPSAQPRKTEAVDFNWDSVLEKRNNSHSIVIEKIEQQPDSESEEISDKITETDEPENEMPLSIEELEKELFGSPDEEKPDSKDFEPTIVAGADTWLREDKPQDSVCEASDASEELPHSEEQRFYTYNQKFDAFQQLLDKERERLRNMEGSYNQEEDDTGSTEDAEVPAGTEQVEMVSVALPAASMTVDLSNHGEAESESEDAKESEPCKESEPTPSKSKLRYSDIFPGGLVDDDGTGPSDSAETEQKIKKEPKTLEGIYDNLDDDEEKVPRRYLLAKIIIAILIILIVIEGAVLAIKLIAPESRISLWADNLMMNVVDLVTGKGNEDDQGAAAAGSDTNEEVYMSNLVKQASEDAETIGETVFTPDLKFSLFQEYSFEEISDTESFVDADWLQDQNGNPVTYGQKITTALVNYYDGWQSANSDESVVGINKLEIGEIRTGEEGFYVLCRITYAGKDGGSIVKYQAVYLKISGEAMIINEIKEENL